MDSNTHRAAAPVGGARADFVAQLGRRVGELRQSLAALALQRGSARAREDLKRRVHALGAAAGVLKLDALVAALSSAEALLARGALAGVSQRDIDELGATLDSLVALAWGEESAKPAAPAPPAAPSTVLIVGPAPLAAALASDDEGGVECERLDDARGALELARALAPDVVLLDADVAGTDALAEALVDDPLTEPVPIVVLGRFAQPESASRWLALGVARVLPKPSSPDVLREACASAARASRRDALPEALGTMNVDELALRLSEELRRGLSDATSTDARGRKIALGEGHEVLAALWSAVARVREIVTVRSGGVVRFSEHGPAGAITVGSFAPDARMPGARGGATPDVETRLDGVTVIVADDDPAVRWFLAGVLRAAQATVHEAEDGERALGLAYRVRPDLVISDVLMPKLDGFSLCQTLKRDVELRDVPVILLSWKEDLLQRVRELGADADGYLRKEASGSVALARVREVLRARLRAEARLRAGGEVRGRLDGLTVATLLAMTSRHHRGATVSVRDASFLYEIEIRDGAPVRATRTASDGTFERGAAVLASSLGATAGRFVVTPATSAVRRELEGTLAAQLAPCVARARAAQRLLSSASLMEVGRVELSHERLAPYLSASPAGAQAIAEKLVEGVSPRQLLLRSGVSPRALEDFLSDAAAHGAIAGVFDPGGEDLLGPRADAELRAISTGESAPVAPRAPRIDIEHAAALTPSPLAPAMPAPTPTVLRTPTPMPAAPSEEDALVLEAAPEPLFPALTVGAAETDSAAPPATVASGALAALRVTTPSPLEAAVLSVRPAPSATAATLDLAAAREAAPHLEVIPDAEPSLEAVAPLVVEPSLEPAPLLAIEPAPPPDAAPPLDERAVEQPGAAPSFPAPSGRAPRVEAAPTPKPRAKGGWLAPTLVVAIAGACAAFVLSRPVEAPRPAPTSEHAETKHAEPPAASVAPVVHAAPATPVASSSATPKSEGPFEDLPLPPGVSVPEGQGMIEVVAGKRDQVSVDRQDLGRGPRVTATLTPGTHDVRAKRKGEEQPMVVLIRPGRRTRVDLRAPWHR